MTLVKCQGVTLTFDTHVASFTHLVDCKYKIKSSQATIVSKKLTISTFSHINAYVTKFDLDVNWVKVNCLFVLRFYCPVNPMGSCQARSIYLATHLLGRLSPLSG